MNHLSVINDPLIQMFKEKELQPIKDNSIYHSPDLSETDNEHPGKRKLVTKDLEWRSTSVRIDVEILIFSNTN